jgi:hypothetical protein
MNINDLIIKLKNIETQIKEYKFFLGEVIKDTDFAHGKEEILGVYLALDAAIGRLQTLTDRYGRRPTEFYNKILQQNFTFPPITFIACE